MILDLACFCIFWAYCRMHKVDPREALEALIWMAEHDPL